MHIVNIHLLMPASLCLYCIATLRKVTRQSSRKIPPDETPRKIVVADLRFRNFELNVINFFKLHITVSKLVDVSELQYLVAMRTSCIIKMALIILALFFNNKY